MKLHRSLRHCLPLLLLAPVAAFAHVGADGSAHHHFLDGFAHPFTGLDHLAAMLAVGIWSALSSHGDTKRVWLAPLTFAFTLLIGAFLAHQGLALPLIEPMIVASLLVLGLLVTTHARLATPVAATLVAVFALFHGAAHGNELVGFKALGGMVLATALLHGAGLLIGRWLQDRNVALARLVGIVVTAFGVFTGFSLMAG